MNAQLVPLSPTRGYIGGKPTRKGVPNRKGVLTVEAVCALYEAGHTQDEIADRLDVSQYKVSYFMKHNGIATRVAAKRNQTGDRNHVWSGDQPSYLAAHKRVYRARGKACKCEHCGASDDQMYHWANVSGNYADINDFIQLCVSCHRKFDASKREAGNAS
jgi:hypothetical protein